MSNIELKDCSLLAGYPGDIDAVEEGGEEVGGRPAFHGPGELRRQDARLPRRYLKPYYYDAL